MMVIKKHIVKSSVLFAFSVLCSMNCGLKEDKVVVYARYTGNTDPEWEPKYKIDSIYSQEVKVGVKEGLMKIRFSNVSMDSAFQMEVVRCPICYSYVFWGKIEYIDSQKYYFLKVDSFRTSVDSSLLDD